MQLHFVINATGGSIVGKALKTVLHYVLILGSMKPEYLFEITFYDILLCVSNVIH